MKKCPKTLAAAIAAAMIATMGSGAVFAEDTDTTGSIPGTGETATTGQTTVKYTVTGGYEWSIHTAINFTDNLTVGNETVKVTKNVIPENKKLQITVKGDGDNSAFTIKNQAGTVLSYEVKENNSKINVNGEVLSVKSGTNEGTASLTFNLTKLANGNTAEVPGEYTGKVIYTASVVDNK